MWEPELLLDPVVEHEEEEQEAAGDGKHAMGYERLPSILDRLPSLLE